jgi:hypothetical protein
VKPFLSSARRRAVVLAAVVALASAGCVGATASNSAAASSPKSSSTATTGPVPSATPPASPSATPTAVADPLPNVPQAPSATWTSIKWTALPAAPEFGAQTPVEGSKFQVFGWSRGYVGFALTPGVPTADQIAAGTNPSPTLVSSYSTDGVDWHTGEKLDTSGAPNLAVIRTVIEGPGGLLAVGWWGSCASEYLDSLWTSTDGISWTPVNVSAAFGEQPMPIAHISGGAAGYVAVAYRSAAVWTSKNGRVWQRLALDTGSLKNSAINDGTAVSGGFVLAGTEGTGDCSGSSGSVASDGPTPAPVFTKAGVWWSADGSSWTHPALPGVVANSGYQDTWVSNLGDQGVLLVEDTYSSGPPSRSAWASKDGRTWASIKLPADINQPAVIAEGQHNLIVDNLGSMVSAPLNIRTIGSDFRLIPVSQTGTSVPDLVYRNWDGPYAYGMVAVGPTGVVVADADGPIWFGTPSAE